MPSQEILQNRELTTLFISMDPSVLTLTPVERSKQPAGGIIYVDGAARAPQTFKMIFQGGEGMIDADGGKETKYQFVLLGEWDAEVEIGDFWVEGLQKYVVVGKNPHNGYETKVGVVSYGQDPSYG